MQHGNRLFLLSMLTALGCPTDPVETDDDGSTGTAGPDDTTGAPTTSDDDTTSLDSSSGSDGDSTTGDASSSGTTEATDSTGDPTTSGTTGETTGSTGETGDTESTGETTGDPSSAVEACEAFFELYYVECYGGVIPDGYCEELVQYYGAYYPEGCVDAQADLWSCLSMLECKDFGDDIPPECAKELAAAEEACPSNPGSFCGSGGGGGGPGSCEFIAQDCIDGNDYGVECAGMTCSCTMNGMEVMTFPYDGSDCFDDEFLGSLDAGCGFPAGVFNVL